MKFVQVHVFKKIYFMAIFALAGAALVIWQTEIGFWKYAAYLVAGGLAATFLCFLYNLFIAQYKMWQDETEKYKQLKRLFRIGEYAPDEQPLWMAVEYIKEISNYGLRTRQIISEIFDLVRDGDIQMQGYASRPKIGPTLQYQGRQMDDYRSVIPIGDQFSYKYYPKFSEPQKPAVEVTKNREDESNLFQQTFGKYFQVTIYYDPVVSMAQIKKCFEDREF